jgi:hypothetical protein
MLKLEKFIVQYTNKSKKYIQSAKFFMQYIFTGFKEFGLAEVFF